MLDLEGQERHSYAMAKKKASQPPKTKVTYLSQEEPETSIIQESPAIYMPRPAPSTPTVSSVTGRYGLKQETLSRMTGFSLRSVAEWGSGKEPSAPAKRVITELNRLLDALAQHMLPKEVGQWLKEPNPAFDGSTPLQVIESGQIDRLWRMLYQIESGEPG